ncbi:MAG: hypothetical protein ACTSR3_01365 [Candidatus Helarchaeota archaeon]
MKITKKTLEKLVEKLNAEFKEILEKKNVEFRLTHNTTYNLPYRLVYVYKGNYGEGNIGTRKTSKEMFNFLRGLLRYDLPF